MDAAACRRPQAVAHQRGHINATRPPGPFAATPEPMTAPMTEPIPTVSAMARTVRQVSLLQLVKLMPVAPVGG